MNQILGGSFGSRLVDKLREDLGYTYSIGSGFNTPAEQGYFRVRASVRNDVAGPALQAILDEIEGIRSEPVESEELEEVKSNIIGRYALRLESYQDFVVELASLRLAGLPLERLSTYLADIENVTQDDVLEAAQEYIDPEKFIIVVVGDASVIQESLEEIGPVTEIE